MRRSIAVALLLVPAVLAAQDSTSAPRSYTRMILGAGGRAGYGASILVGVDHKQKASKLGVRVVAEYQESRPRDLYVTTDQFYHSKTFGLQLLGMRPFREGRRIEPYMFAGVGIYHGTSTSFRRIDDPSNPSSSQLIRSHDTSPELLWGVGSNVRIMGMSFFGDVKLPTWGGSHYRFGEKAGTFKIGVRF